MVGNTSPQCNRVREFREALSHRKAKPARCAGNKRNTTFKRELRIAGSHSSKTLAQLFCLMAATRLHSMRL